MPAATRRHTPRHKPRHTPRHKPRHKPRHTTRRSSSCKSKSRRKLRTQRGGNAFIYDQAWRAFIDHGTVTDFTQTQLKNVNLYFINSDYTNPKHPERTLTTFVDAILKPAPINIQDTNTWRTMILPRQAPITNDLMAIIADRSPHLDNLTINYCPSLTDEHLRTFYQTRLGDNPDADPYTDIGNVDIIDFKGCTSLTPNSAEFFYVYEPITLNLSDISTLTDEWVINSLPEEGTPWTLILNNAPLLTHATVIATAEKAHNLLRNFQIRNNPNIDYTAVEAIAQAANLINYADFQGCPHIEATLAANPLPPGTPRPNIQNPFPLATNMQQVRTLPGQPPRALWQVPPPQLPPAQTRRRRGI